MKYWAAALLAACSSSAAPAPVLTAACVGVAQEVDGGGLDTAVAEDTADVSTPSPDAGPPMPDEAACKASTACKVLGLCSWQAGHCVATTYDCKLSEVCQKYGDCEAHPDAGQWCCTHTTAPGSIELAHGCSAGALLKYCQENCGYLGTCGVSSDGLYCAATEIGCKNALTCSNHGACFPECVNNKGVACCCTGQGAECGKQ